MTSPEEARVWIDRFKRTLADETADPAELLAGWAEFRRTFTRGFWPIPGAVCDTIREARKARRAYDPEPRPAFEALPAPARGRRYCDMSPEEQQAFDARMAAARDQLRETARAMSSPLAALGPKHTRNGPQNWPESAE